MGNEEIVFEVVTHFKDKELRFGLVLKDMDDDQEPFGIILFYEGENKYHFSFEDEKFVLPLNFLGTGCLLKCGIGLVGPIIDCFRTSGKSWKKFKRCLKEQGVTLALGVMICIEECLTEKN